MPINIFVRDVVSTIRIKHIPNTKAHINEHLSYNLFNTIPHLSI